MTITSVTKKRLSALLIFIIILAVVVYSGTILAKKLWSLPSQIFFELAKVEWTKGHRQKAVELWVYGIDKTIRDTINRERAYRILQQSDNLLKEGKLTDALNSCYRAAKIYDEEGGVSYKCMLIEQRILGAPTLFPLPSPKPSETLTP
jgi:hypothetical protein